MFLYLVGGRDRNCDRLVDKEGVVDHGIHAIGAILVATPLARDPRQLLNPETDH